MKHSYLLFLILLLQNLGLANEDKIALLPSATIAGTTTVCQNTASPLITFTGNGGTAPYTFTYTVTGVAGNQTISTTGTNNSVTVAVPTGTAGTFTYTLVSVADSLAPSNPVSVTGNAIVTINPQANANLNSSAVTIDFNGFTTFRVCSNQAAQFEFFNASTTISTNTTYTINWGDGSPNFSGAAWSNLSHTYQVGLWTLTYTITAQNGCNITKIYKVFVGNNPAVGLGNPGNTDICISSSLTFPITGTDNNPPGTTYVVTFNDGSAPINFNHPPPASVTHTFLISSCNTTSTSGTTTFQNSFFASIAAINPCDVSSASVVPIRISTAPTANFSLPQNTVCTGNQICFTNTSTGGDSATSTSCSTPKLIWTITPDTGFSLSSGTLGNDFGSTNTNSWTSGTPSICPIFSISGTYTIKLKIGNRCGIDEITKVICVQSTVTPQFTLNTTTGCTPVSVTATNNTNLANQCATPTYLWAVTYAATFCGTTIPTIPNQTTQNASYNFTEPGTYTIRLSTTNACGTTTTTQVVTVKKPPTAAIAAIPNSCGTANITPTATVNSCAPLSSNLTYAWSFPGGTPSTANTANPGTINYPSTGNYTVSLVVSNECGVSNTATRSFSVSTAPVITNTNLSQTICSGSQTSLVNLTANPPTTTFAWTATATAGITGFIASGTSNTIPVQTITTSSATAGTITYIVTPTVGGCVGTPVNYVINVNPAPSITTQPTPSTVCLGGTPTTLSVVLNSASGTPTYQWYSNSVNAITGSTLIPGATNSSFNPPASAVGTTFYYSIISLTTGGCSGLTSNIVAVVVNPLPTITTQPIPTQNLCVGVTIASPLTVAYTGGTGTASYQWFSSTNNTTTGGTPVGTNSPNYTPPIFTTAGAYYFYVTITVSGNNCGTITSNSAEIIVFDDPTVTTQPLISQTLCQGATPTTLEVVATGGSGTFSYQWYSNSANNTTTGNLIVGATNATFIPPTTTVGTRFYYCIISQTGTSGCSVTSAIATVIINASPIIVNQPVSSTVCSGGTPTVLSFTFSNGVGTPTYQWFSNSDNNNTTGTAIPGETNPTFLPPAISVGTVYYYSTITFSGITGSCATISTNTANVTVTAGSTISQQPVQTQTLCIGATITNPLTVSFTGGTGTPSYQWFSNTTNFNVGGVAIAGATNASFTPSVFSTPGTFYYYAVISFSGNGCGAITSDIAEVIVVDDPIITTQPLVSQTVCQNSPATVLTVVVSGGVGATYNYQWFSSTSNNTNSGTIITGETNNTFTPPTNTAGTTYYYCVITQTNGTGCNATSNAAEVIINIAPAINVQPTSNTLCLNNSPPALSFTISNGVGIPLFQWYSNATNSNTGGNLILGATSETYTPATIVSGTTYFYCIVTFPSIIGGCSVIATDPAMITVNENPVIAATTTIICSATSFTINPINGGGNIVPLGTTYTWSAPIINPAGAVTGATAQTTGQSNSSQTLVNTTTSPATVTYTVTPTSGLCIGNNFTVTVTVNPAINPNVVASNSTCFGINNASITTNITGGIPPYTINWTGPNGFTSTANNITSIAPGVYNVTIDDTGGCPFSNSYTITEPADLIINVDSENDITCFGSANGSVAITITGGTGNYIYNWTNNGSSFAATEDIANLSPGAYVVSVTDANNCGPKTATFTISQPPILAVSLVSQTNVLCFNAATGAITVNVTGGTPVQISPGVFDYLYSWTGPNGFTSANQNLNNILAGTYNLTVTDNLGCTRNLQVVISQSTEIIVGFTTTPITCFGANNASITATISGGNGPYQYQWNNLATTLNQANLSAGTYIITVTDNVGCTKVQNIIIPEAPIFTINPIVTNVTCFGANNGSINLNLTGGIAPVTLTWSDGSTSGLIRNNLPPGTYTATISDGTPCFIVRTFTIIQPQALVLAATTTNPLDCSTANSGLINLIVSGGTPPFNFNWSNGATSEDLSNLNAGNYFVTVTDANNCVITGQYSLVRPAPVQIVVTTQTDFNCETREVTQNFVAQASGGIPPYQYQWSSGNVSGANNQIMNSTANGVVILTITDSAGCTANYTVDVDNPVIGDASFEATSFGFATYGIYSIGDPIQFNSTITGDYIAVRWDFGDGTFSTEVNPVHTYQIPRDYIVTQTVTYPFGCVYVQTISLLVEKGYLLVVPTAFTPNRDTLNDTYRPVTKRLKEVQLDIYDTWGSLIYSEKGDVLIGWDGTIKGFNAENGNYYSKVKAETFYGTIVNENQTFVLIK